nr:nucleotidyltransferase family protein [Parahaliea mediterranea]
MLAAGSSRRFGGDKRFARLGGGDSVFEASIRAARASGLSLCVCLRPDDTRALELLARLGVDSCACADAARGMGHTLAQGIAAAADWDAALIALADMPWVLPATYRAVAAAAGPRRIVVPSRGGRRGHPVAFGAAFYPELARLEGDAGARRVLARHAGRVCELEVDDPGILRDVDRPADLGG